MEPKGSSYGVVAYMLDGKIVVSEFELQSRYYVYFRTNIFRKGMNPLIPPSYGLNSIITGLLPEWLWL